jgi:hypothetical protein
MNWYLIFKEKKCILNIDLVVPTPVIKPVRE